jgi:hypothetical protein
MVDAEGVIEVDQDFDDQAIGMVEVSGDESIRGS